MEPTVKLLTHTPDPERLIAIAARTSYRNKDSRQISSELSERNVERIIHTVITKNHLSVLEHVCFTFEISGVSRVLSHQLLRHRIASYSQLSQQRTDSSDLEFTIPPEIERNHELAEDYKRTVLYCQEVYKRLVDCGISRGAARYILPSGFGTRIITTLNARSLFNLLAQRECGVEDWEFRQVAHLMHTELMKVSPAIFQYAGPPCQTQRFCPEGKEPCECQEYLKVTPKEKVIEEGVKLQTGAERR